MAANIHFCATSKSGLGHLRRITNIATVLKHMEPALSLGLVTNAPVAGVSAPERRLFEHAVETPRPEMAKFLRSSARGPVIIDTAVLPGVESLPVPLCLILRETRASKLNRFRLANGRPWDLVLLPNPADDWLPDTDVLAARRVEAVGWIFRRAPAGGSRRALREGRPATVLVASGGGGDGSVWEDFRRSVAAVIEQLRRSCRAPFEVVQALGPRATDRARVAGIDRVVRPGSRLHERFAGADLVISSAGYNSVLEIASTDTPVLLVPIPATYDDQQARASRWESRLGCRLLADDTARSARWARRVIESRQRRAPVRLDDSGDKLAAALLAELAGRRSRVPSAAVL